MENPNEKPLRTKLPPFLEKVFEMVEDRNTNELISWGDNNQSFIIWDQFEFSSILLTKYFKHNNFSSFICQLGSYGFKKAHHTRIEYANKWFMAGEKQLLFNIERRIPRKRENKVEEIPTVEPKKLRILESEIKYLKSEHKILEVETQELRKNNELIANKVANNMSKKENEMINLIREFVKNQANKAITNDDNHEEMTGTVILNPSLTTKYSVILEEVSAEDGVPAVCKKEGEGELTEFQLKCFHEWKNLIS